ncbi:2-isopropylmalate synthase [Erysipelotrichaceae bacterium]|nr:2-isopropylmalate synthase [Erysipelotrichaceae bacterium]
MNTKKYSAFPKVSLKDRKWPDNEITHSPIWCSVDLRDGNQALVIPMSVEQKVTYFDALVAIGFKEIELAFPSASDTDFKFVRRLIEDGHIPDDVTIQVLVQARRHLIERTIAAVQGAKNIIIHLYNSTSTLQREIVFGKTKAEVKQIALDGVAMIKENLHLLKGSNVRLEYSPESFMGTELDYALEVVNAVIEAWDPIVNKGTIINLPLTVEEMMPNIYADQIEYMDRHIIHRGAITISVHTHNDRGTGVAASELALLAGADRVEGTLFGNGERTGNADIMILALNLYTHGIDPNLDFSNIDSLIAIYEKEVGMSIHPRHPYAGELVYTAFSGSHQDAINKGFTILKQEKREQWCVPYLTIDPEDVGRTYEAIIRINSQSGKGGIAYILDQEYGCILPKRMHPEIGKYAKEESDKLGIELTKEMVYRLFTRIFTLDETQLLNYTITEKSGDVSFDGDIFFEDKIYHLTGNGNGPLNAFIHSFNSIQFGTYNIESYSEHSLNSGSEASAVTYVQVKDSRGFTHFGAGISENTTRSAITAILAAVANIKKRFK